MPIYELSGKKPLIAPTTYIHPTAVVIGDVQLGDQCFVGAGAVIRADHGKIVIGSGCAIEENCVIHSEPATIAIIEDNVIVGHGAIIHGPCLLRQHAVVGMGSIISSGCELGEHSFLGAGSLLAPGKLIPSRKLAVGNPARITKSIDGKLLEYSHKATRIYRDLARQYQSELKQVDGE